MTRATPPLLVAGGPGRGIEIADGWITFLPPSGSPECYAEQVRDVKWHAEQAGRDPEELMFETALCCVIARTEDKVDEAARNLALRWYTAALTIR